MKRKSRRSLIPKPRRFLEKKKIFVPAKNNRKMHLKLVSVIPHLLILIFLSCFGIFFASRLFSGTNRQFVFLGRFCVPWHSGDIFAGFCASQTFFAFVFPLFFLTRAGNLGVVGVFPVQSSQKEVFLRRKPMASTSLLKRLFIKHLLLNECLFCVCEREKIDARHDKSFFFHGYRW